jgi:hypothetical protein
VSAVEAPAPERRGWFPAWADPRHWHRRVRDGIEGTREALADSQALLLSGEKVQLRFVQSLYWSVFVGLVFAQFVFGLYDGVLQVHWYITIPHFAFFPGWHQELFYLKPGWDKDCFGLVHSGNWPLYRHLSFRDVAGPALATMGIVTLLAKPYKGKPVRTARMVTAPLVVIALTFALGVLGVYLAYFGLPDLWHHVLGSYTVPGTKWLGYLSADNFAIGFVITKILHRYWAPVGATLQGVGLDRSVDRWQTRIAKAGMSLDDAIRYSNAGLHILPTHQRRPVLAPVLRERWAALWRANKDVSVSAGRAWVYVIVAVFFVLVVLLGATGHYVAGHGISVPYLFPGAGH